MNAPLNTVRVHLAQDGHPGHHFLRVYLDAGPGGTLQFESEKALTKPEADYRAVLLASRYGFERDELPTHPYTECYPLRPEAESGT